MGAIVTRFGDGSATTLNAKELRADLGAGTADAAARGKIPPLTAFALSHHLAYGAVPGCSRSRYTQFVMTVDLIKYENRIL